MRLRWESGQPARTAAWLSDTLDLPVVGQPDRLEIGFWNAVLEITPIPGPERPSADDRLRIVDASAGDEASGSPLAAELR